MSIDRSCIANLFEMANMIYLIVSLFRNIKKIEIGFDRILAAQMSTAIFLSLFSIFLFTKVGICLKF